jgi:hypothetical protein
MPKKNEKIVKKENSRNFRQKTEGKKIPKSNRDIRPALSQPPAPTQAQIQAQAQALEAKIKAMSTAQITALQASCIHDVVIWGLAGAGAGWLGGPDAAFVGGLLGAIADAATDSNCQFLNSVQTGVNSAENAAPNPNPQGPGPDPDPNPDGPSPDPDPNPDGPDPDPDGPDPDPGDTGDSGGGRRPPRGVQLPHLANSGVVASSTRRNKGGKV